MRTILFAILLAMCGAVVPCHGADDKRPNILLILADDLGFSDLGCYGSSIETPNLDALAAGGLRFTHFYNTGRCWPTRSSMLTGVYPHQAQMAMTQGPDAPPAYRGQVPPHIPLLSETLGAAGYRCYHSGKWHIGRDHPMDRGFDHTYYIAKQDNYFFPRRVYEDRKEIDDFPDDYYATDALTDRTLSFLKEHDREHAGKPFFMYLAYTAPHFPLHARAEDIARYRGRFREGWDVERQRRHARQRELGIYDGPLSKRDPESVAWDSLSDAEKEMWDTRMAIHAAMIDRVDQNIGRVLDHLRKTGQFDNTIVLFLSDNGASAEYIVRGEGHDPSAPPGSRKSYLCLEVGWANASNTPFREHKIWVHEGGISTPLIVHWPAGITAKVGSLVHHPGHVIDVAPTLLEAAGVKHPAQFAGGQTLPLPGRSFAAAFTGKTPTPHDAIYWEHTGNRAIREGHWKLVADRDGPWTLHDLRNDRIESHDLTSEKPELAKRLREKWEQWAQSVGVVDWDKFGRAKRPSREYREK